MLMYIIFGVIVGFAVTSVMCRARSAGTLIVVKSDETGEPPYIFFEIDDPKQLLNDEYVRLRVKRKKADTHK